MTYRSRILEDGRIDMASLPPLPPGTLVDISVPKTVESLYATFAKLAEIGKASQEIYRGPYDRARIYEEEE